jgi:hypothetical protein
MRPSLEDRKASLEKRAALAFMAKAMPALKSAGTKLFGAAKKGASKLMPSRKLSAGVGGGVGYAAASSGKNKQQ